MESNTAYRRIIRLPQDVVNKIAAGEVVVRPVNAVKELIENGLDSGATEIIVSICNGGLTSIKIQDNGHGINREDLPIVCCRFTTSKLKEYEDLRHIKTYGFRGEALASLSYVSNLTITTRTLDGICANKATYRDGKIIGNIEPSAGLKGTIICAEQLFYNTPSRLATFQYPNEESRRIADLIIRYAIHYPNISFAYQRLDGTSHNFRTSGNGDLHSTIRKLLHEKATKQLIDFEFNDSTLHFNVSACMCIPAVLFTSRGVQARNDKLKVFHLFINDRSVECPRLQRSFDCVFSSKDAFCPFITLSLLIDPERVDVNIHPNKTIVHFLNEDQIIERIEQEMHSMLTKNRTRDTIDPNNEFNNINQNKPLEELRTNKKRKKVEHDLLTSQSAASAKKHNTSIIKVAPKDKIRVDFTNRTLDEFFLTKEDMERRPTSQVCLLPIMDVTLEEQKRAEGEAHNPIILDDTKTEKLGIDAEGTSLQQTFKCIPRMFDIESLVELRKEICRSVNKELVEVFKRHLLVGFYSTRYALIQSGAKLFLVRNDYVLFDFFYQLIIFSFGNIGAFDLMQSGSSKEFLSVTELLQLYVENMDINGKQLKKIELKQRIDHFSNVLIQNRNMLWNYFSIKIFLNRNKGEDVCEPVLAAIPCLIDGYLPELRGLPRLLFQLASVNYANEKSCYFGVASALAEFHLPFMDDTADPIGDNLMRRGKNIEECERPKENDEKRTQRRSAQRLLRALVFPALRNHFLPGQKLQEHVKMLTSTAQAFKHFGRC